MAKLVYGKAGQVKFENEEEKREAFEYLVSSPNVEFHHEQNQNQGAWASEKRILFRSRNGVPESLQRNWTAGRGESVVGRINCAELYDEVEPMRNN